MHIPDGWIDLPTTAGAAVVGGAAVAVAGRRTAARLRERATTLPAVLAAYLLVAQLPALPIGLGTSAHLVGTGLVTVLVGPSVAIVCVATVVVVQALVLADGGVTALGLNLLANGIVPAMTAAAVLALGRYGAGAAQRSGMLQTRRPQPSGTYPARAASASREHRSACHPQSPADRAIRSGERAGVVRSPHDLARLPVVAGVAAGLATLAAAATVSAELALGGTDVIPAGTVAAVLGGSHLVVAIVEGVVTAAVVGVVARLRPDLLGTVDASAPKTLVER